MDRGTSRVACNNALADLNGKIAKDKKCRLIPGINLEMKSEKQADEDVTVPASIPEFALFYIASQFY